MRPVPLRATLAAPVLALALGAAPAWAQPHTAAISNVEAAGDASDHPDDADLPADPAAQVLADRIHHAFSTRDAALLLSLAKWDGVDEEVRERFSDFVARLVEQDIQGVTLEPLGDDPATFEHRGRTYGKNGEPLGRVTIAFVVEPPTVSERLHWSYGVEDGTALILLDVPVTGSQ